jgi:hypothetical protein
VQVSAPIGSEKPITSNITNHCEFDKNDDKDENENRTFCINFINSSVDATPNVESVASVAIATGLLFHEFIDCCSRGRESRRRELCLSRPLSPSHWRKLTQFQDFIIEHLVY